MTVPSPCISICVINDATGYCKGCFRTLREVADWLYMSDDEKRRVLALIERRRQPPTPPE